MAASGATLESELVTVEEEGVLLQLQQLALAWEVEKENPLPYRTLSRSQ